MDIDVRAAKSKALLNHEHFVEVIRDLRERQKDVFAGTAAHEIERREEAHAIMRATAPWKRLNRSMAMT